MSVINFNKKEVYEMGSRVYSLPKIANLFVYSPNYKKYLSDWNKLDDNNNRKDYLERTFWYLYVSNQIAHSLQYQKETSLFTKENQETEFETLSGQAWNDTTRKQLLQDLGSLRYNMTTNDGNVFMVEPFRKFFDEIVIFIKDQIIKLYDF